MKRPDQYPNRPYAAFVDAVGPTIDEGFLNPTQEGLADLIGMTFGRSATFVGDEFTTLRYYSAAREKFDTWINTNSDSGPRVPTGSGQHGILGVYAVVAGPMTHLLQDAMCHVGTFDFTVSMRAAIDTKAELDTVAAFGWFGGLRDTAPSDVLFVAGSDQPNWHTLIGATLTDTGVPIVDGRFYDLQIVRVNGTATAYIDGALVVTQAFGSSLQQTNRQLGITCPAATINKGYAVDYHRLYIQR